MDPNTPKSDPEGLLAANREFSALNRIVTACTGSLDLEKTLERVLDEALQITGLEGGTICLLGEDQILHLAAQREVSRETLQDFAENQVRVGECLCGACARDLVPLVLPDREAVLSFSSREATRREQINFHAAYPFVTSNSCVGVLCVFTRTAKKPSDVSLKSLEIVTGQVALAIENARLYQKTARHAQEMEQVALKLEQKNRELELSNQELRQSEALLSQVLEHLPVGVWILDRHGEIRRHNQAGHQIWQGALMVGPERYGEYRGWWADSGKQIRAEEWGAARAIRQGETSLNEIIDIECFDGSRKTICHSALPLLDDSGEVTGAIVVNEDISAQRGIQKALQESEQRLRGIADTVNDSIILIDDQGRIVYWNQAAERMFGYTSLEVMGQPIDLIVPRHFREEHRAAFPKFAESGSGKMVGKTCEMSGLRRDGSEFPVELSLSAIRLNNSWHAAGIVRDITERKALEARLNHARKMEAIGTLTGGIAHDFNNILMAIAGFASLAQNKLGSEHPLNGYLANILSASDRAAKLIQSLLLFSRKRPAEAKPADLNQVLMGMQTLLVQMLREDIRLKISTAAEPLPVLVDEGQIGQALLNLASNARDAMPRGGSVSISTERIRIEGASLRIEGGELAPGEYARLCCTDSGLGMDEEPRRRVFEPFFTTKEVGKGTGLGLATTYGIVAQHDGLIECFSQPGLGTAFRIYLPLQRSEAAPAEPKPDAEPVWAGGSETVLLAEDDPPTRGLVREILQENGYRVIEALDGEDAVRQFGEHMESIELAILDVIMPKLNGREVYQRITELKPELRVVFTSGYAADAFREGERPEKDFNFLSKPVAPEALLRMIRKVLDGN